MKRAISCLAWLCLLLFSLPALALETGAGSYEFLDVPSGRTLTVFYYKPASFTDQTPLVISLHGMSRNAQGSRNDWEKHADSLGIAVLAPHFTKEQFAGTQEYNLGNITRDGKKNPEGLWSFRLPDAMFADFVRREKSKVKNFYLFGHSAGGQFVHRMILFQPKTRAKLVMAANSGWYTMPNLDEKWPYGLGGMGLSNADLRRFVSFPLVLLLGEKDNDPTHYQLARGPEVDRQGDNRFARGQYYHSYGQELAKKLNVPFKWRVIPVPGVGHQNGGMVDAAAKVVAEDLAKNR